MVTFRSGGGTSPRATRRANPSTTAVLPTPASPTRIGLFWRRTDLESLEDLEPVLHTGEGPLAFRQLGIYPEQAQHLIKELL